MPIRPENMALYPGGSIRSPEWLAIREQVRERAGDCCEECGVRNGDIGFRRSDGSWSGGWTRYKPGEEIVVPTFGWVQFRKAIKIVCTVAHIDGKLVDHSDANLAFWCQRCHLRHDAAQHQANAAITRHEKVWVRKEPPADG